jgi:multiple antibiotic resistance protein
MGDGSIILLALERFVSAFLFVAAALLPIVNPLGMTPIFLSYTEGFDEAVGERLARRVAYNSFLLATVSLFVGSYVLRFFGLSLAAVQIGGGLVVAATGWRLLNRGEDDPHRHAPPPSAESVMDNAFYPLTMPLTVGPGSIATMITVGSSAPQAAAKQGFPLIQGAGALAGVAAVCLSIYLSYRYAENILRRLGHRRINVLLRLSAFILLCLGVQIVLNGYRALTGGGP